MYDFYDFCEYKSDADEIIEGAVDELRELIKQPIKDKLAKIAKWEETHREQEIELEKKASDIEQQEQKLKKEKEEWESEKGKKPIEFINSAVKQLCNGLQIGQRVWVLKCCPSEHIPCPKCNGTAKVKVQYYNGDTVEQRCSCFSGTVVKYRYQAFEDYVDSVKIRIQLAAGGFDISTINEEGFTSDHVVYLRNNGETPIRNIFSSQQAAKEEADERNKEEEE